MAVVSMRQLLEAGVHFGHQTRRWNPKMRRYIYGERNGIYVIDLRQTVDYIERAYSFVRDLVAGGGNILFIGTKRQARESIQYQAQRVGMPYVTERWLGGMLTNFETIKTRIARLKELEAMDTSGTFELLPKKEVLKLRREHEKLQTALGGIREMERQPKAVWIVDTVIEEIAVKEANRLDIPVVGILDTNCDPDLVQFPIPGNDDAIRSAALLTRIVADACADGLLLRASRSPDEELQIQAMQAARSAGGGLDATEPKAQWEIELEREQAAKQAAVASAGTEAAPSSPPAAPAETGDAADESTDETATESTDEKAAESTDQPTNATTDASTDAATEAGGDEGATDAGEGTQDG
ncbi:MAG: 30S ribosomal protein S2 [Actinobacteria bacterium]|nr:30S ribosomal protein S2 [Actinomycetota bacterium]